MTWGGDANTAALRLILGDEEAIRSLCRRKGADGQFLAQGQATTPASVLSWATAKSLEGYDTWFGIHPLTGVPAPGRRGRAADVASVQTMHVDLDFADEAAHKGAIQCEAEVRARVASFALSPTVTINSGHGLHLYWCLEEKVTPDDGATLICELHRALAEHGLTPERKDLASVLRVPGTLNYKTGRPVPVEAEYIDFALIYEVSLVSHQLQMLGRSATAGPFPVGPPERPTSVAGAFQMRSPSMTPPGSWDPSVANASLTVDPTPKVKTDANSWRYQRHLDDLASTLEGGRNDKLNAVSFKIGQDVVGAICGFEEAQRALDAFADIAMSLGLTESETVATINSGFRSGLLS